MVGAVVDGVVVSAGVVVGSAVVVVGVVVGVVVAVVDGVVVSLGVVVVGVALVVVVTPVPATCLLGMMPCGTSSARIWAKPKERKASMMVKRLDS